MGRPPCCDKIGIKKGPWTPEEDIILVSYIQEHGPGNWRSVPTNTGLMRCSKSCRLRWTNYLRPGIKRGNFTPHEEGMITHLQALLGNKWAAIASYLPQRTDNDIKNYWNTHLKKKLKKFHSVLDPQNINIPDSSTTKTPPQPPPTSSSDNNNNNNLSLVNQSSSSSSSTIYASSTENISRLLEGWMRSSPKSNNIDGNAIIKTADLVSHEELDSILSFDNNVNSFNNNNNVSSWERSSSSTTNYDHHKSLAQIDHHLHIQDHDHDHDQKKPPLSFLEKWLLDETSTNTTTNGQVEELMQLSPILF